MTNRFPVERMTKRSWRSSKGSSSFFRSPPRSTAQMPRPCVCVRTRSTPASTSAFSTAELWGLGRVQFLIQRNDLTAVHFGPGDIAQPVARMHFARATVVHGSQILHLFGVLFADVAQVQAQHSVS